MHGIKASCRFFHARLTLRFCSTDSDRAFIVSKTFHARRDVSARHDAKRRRHRQSFEMDAWIISALIETPNTDTTPLHWKEGGYIGDSTDVGSWQ